MPGITSDIISEDNAKPVKRQVKFGRDSGLETSLVSGRLTSSQPISESVDTPTCSLDGGLACKPGGSESRPYKSVFKGAGLRLIRIKLRGFAERTALVHLTLNPS